MSELTSLIPASGPETGDYYCTWRSQATVIRNDSYEGVLHRGRTADTMCEAVLFGDTVGILRKIPISVRGDLIVVLDDGWDIPYDLNPSGRDGGNADFHRYGSLIADPERFPACAALSRAVITYSPRLIRGISMRKASRSRRLTRFLVTALPIFLLTAKPASNLAPFT